MEVKMTRVYTITVGNEEVDAKFQISADMFFQAGRFSGPPEKCYPDDSECEVTEVNLIDGPEGLGEEEAISCLQKSVSEDQIESDLWEEYSSDQEDRRDTYRDYIRDMEAA